MRQQSRVMRGHHLRVKHYFSHFLFVSSHNSLEREHSFIFVKSSLYYLKGVNNV